jgi:hypothetical protein
MPPVWSVSGCAFAHAGGGRGGAGAALLRLSCGHCGSVPLEPTRRSNTKASLLL